MKTQEMKSLKYNTQEELLARFKAEKSDAASILFGALGQLRKWSFYNKMAALVAAGCLISLAIIFIF